VLTRNAEVNKTQVNVDIKELIGRCAGHAVADATCALARALYCYSTGASDKELDEMISWPLELLRRALREDQKSCPVH
jgi:hypothetical protein